jgi:hypothetical protein
VEIEGTIKRMEKQTKTAKLPAKGKNVPSKPSKGKPKKETAKGATEKKDESKEAKAEKSQPPANFAHMYTGPRRLRVKMDIKDYQRVMNDQQRLLKDIDENKAKARDKEEQISDAQEHLATLRAQHRDIERMIEEETRNILEIIQANKDGFHIEAVEVDEIFDKGEIISYKRGTKLELARRNATGNEHEAALTAKDAAGRLINRWAKGKPDGDGWVLVDVNGSGKPRRVRGHGEWGYVGPDADPVREPPKVEEKKRGRPKKEVKQAQSGQADSGGGKVLPFSLVQKDKTLSDAVKDKSGGATTDATDPKSAAGSDTASAAPPPSEPKKLFPDEDKK